MFQPTIKMTTMCLVAIAQCASFSAVCLAGGAAALNDMGSPDSPGSEHLPTAEQLIRVPIVGLTPGDVKVSAPHDVSTLDSKSVERGMQYFSNFNCVGCHMGNGGGGMGPALSNHAFIYGGEPANIFLSIYQGRPHGMPAWGTVLPETMIWDLVAYVKSLSDAPVNEWGTTTSRTSPAIEQVPKELKPMTPHPWQYTQKFSNGQPP